MVAVARALILMSKRGKDPVPSVVVWVRIWNLITDMNLYWRSHLRLTYPEEEPQLHYAEGFNKVVGIRREPVQLQCTISYTRQISHGFSWASRQRTVCNSGDGW